MIKKSTFIKQKRKINTLYPSKETACLIKYFISFLVLMSFTAPICAEEPTFDIEEQNGKLIVTVSYPVEGDTPLGDEFYNLVLDSEEKIATAYATIQKASQKKDWDAITQAQKTIRDQLSFNAYQIKKIDVNPDLVQMTDNYYQSLQYETQMFDAAYMQNIGKGDYSTIQKRMKEAEGKSDEYYRKFMADLKKNNGEVYSLVKAIGEE